MNNRDRLSLFNGNVLLNKREILESFDDFVSHHQEKNNQKGYSEGKRKVLLSLCQQFRKELLEKDIPSQAKNWLYYEYSITNDSIELSLYKCDNAEFDDDGGLSEMTGTKEYTLVEVKCEYLTVEQYADQYGVTTTTVRQWIRRGKLRTAKKSGRDWLIPALADKPKRGFQDVSYEWKLLPVEIIEAFPFLADVKSIYISQDKADKKIFWCITGWPGNDHRQRIKMTGRERERLEILLIGTPGIAVSELESGIMFVPAKKSSSPPVLSSEFEAVKEIELPFSDIIVRQNSRNVVLFPLNSSAGSSLQDEYPALYLHPIYWEFWGVPNDSEDIAHEFIDDDNYSDCIKLGSLSGYFILCCQMIMDGYEPLIVCDDESADLGNMMAVLTGEGGPLNDVTGDSMQDVLYIDELIVEEPLRQKGIGTRLIQELPYLCKGLLHLEPDILAYYVSPIRSMQSGSVGRKDAHDNLNPENKEDLKYFRFYKSNGFQELGDSRLMYAFTDMF